ncbi:hypothetical protein [Streptomyces malaysiensis]|uniref:hypothetical protein n=1 Tax=Streptomyces malaysiensis TaxID=92644 RepID=UPI002B2BD8A7|nr:hypothetical protein R8789_33005 [Streptomyces malaysiensis]
MRAGPTGPSKAVLVAREWVDETAWLLGAPLATAAVVSAWWAGAHMDRRHGGGACSRRR